jgi:signal transduction histidine kinase
MLFQAARELLVNVVKHSRADKAIVRITGKGRKIRIEVTDNGTGFDKSRAFRVDINNGGFGIFSIRERLKHFGGNLIIQSREGKGTRVIITSPLERLDPH